MNLRQPGPLVIVMALLFGACSGNAGTSTAVASSGTPETVAPAATADQDGGTSSAGPRAAGVDEALERLLAETRQEINAVHAECSAGEGKVQPGADFSNRTFSGPELRCADLSNASFRGAVLHGVDLSGANLTGADFTDATLSITGVGADFTRAVFTGADLERSDLRGAVFASADLTGSKMTSLPGGLTLGYLDGARLGCNVLYGSPGVTVTNVTIVDDCRTLKAFNRVTFAGSFYAADLTDMDFSSVLVEATDFRLAKMSGVNLADYGVFPAADFSGAQLVDADLSNVGFYDTTFVGTNLTGTNLDGVSVVGSDFSGANFEFVSMVGFTSQRSRYVDAMFNEVDLTDGSLSFDNFERAIFGQIVATNLVIDTISCPGAISTSRYGLCTVGNDVAF